MFGKKEKKAMSSKKGIITVLFPLVIALALFFVLVGYQEAKLKGYNKVKAVVALEEVPKKTEITKENVSKYFVVEEVDESVCVKNVVSDLDDLVGTVTGALIDKNRIVCKNDFVKSDDYLNSLDNPIEISFSVESADLAIGGTVRKGDFIDVSVLNEEVLENVLSHVYVKQVYDSSAIEIKGTDSTPAVTFVVVMDESQKAEFLEKTHDADVFVTAAASRK